MRIIFTVFILFYTWQAWSQELEHIYTGKDTTFYRVENFIESKRTLRHATDAFLGYSTGMLGSGFVSSIDSKESKLSAQFFGNSSSSESDVVTACLNFSGTTDDAFYGVRGLKRPTFSIGGGLFILIEPGTWRLNEQDYLSLTKNPDIKFSDAKPFKTSFKWMDVSGNFDYGELKLSKLDSNVLKMQIEFIRTNRISISYNILRSFNSEDYNIRSVKSKYFSIGLDWVRLSNLRNLPTIDANIQSTALDTSGATINLYNDLGTHYISTPEAPFVHYNETVFKLHYMIESINGWVVSIAGNYHRPLSNEDDSSTLLYNEKRNSYFGFEGGIHYSAKNKAGKSIANIGVYGDFNYTNRWDSWIVSLRTSIPISL